jgi:spermidine synthase
MAQPKNNWLYVSLFIISMSLLMFEIATTRATKIAFGNNFQFIILSLAILGIGIGGMIVYFFFNKLTQQKVAAAFLMSVITYAVLILLPFLVLPYRMMYAESFIKIFFFVLAFLFYITAGIYISLVFRYYSENVSKLYFITLVGSAVGAIATLVFLNLAGTETTIAIMFLIGASAIVSQVAYNGRGKKIIVAATAILVIALLIFNFLPPLVKILCDSNTGLIGRSATLLASESNAYSQIDTYKVSARNLFKAEESVFNPKDTKTVQVFSSVIDCIGFTEMGKADDLSKFGFLKKSLTYFPYHIKNYNQVLVIGSGLGIDTTKAVIAGTDKVTAVEINPLIVSMSHKLDSKNNVYDLPNVDVHVREGRSFVAAAKQKYDLIYIASTKRYGGLGLKPYAFSENYLFTKEAFDLYLTHLNQNGILFLVDLSWFTQRYTNTIIKRFLDKGLNPADYIIMVVGTDRRSSVLVKNEPFSEEEKDIIAAKASELNFKAKFLTEADIATSKRVIGITDDRPFYWNRDTIRSILHGSREYSELEGRKNETFISLSSLFVLLLVSFIIYIAMFSVPLMKHKHEVKKALCFLLYFSSLGMGFIIFELVFIQRFTLFLPNPSISLALVLASVLVFSGIGSLLTQKVTAEGAVKKIRIVITSLSVLMLLFVFFVDTIFEYVHLDLTLKVIISIIILALPSTLMGMPFPLGIKIVNKANPYLIPWMWGINGIATVLGSVASMILAIIFGFKAAIIFGIIIYLLGMIALSKLSE